MAAESVMPAGMGENNSPPYGGKLKSAVFLDAALEAFKAAGAKIQEDVIAAEPAADIAAKGGDILQKFLAECLHGRDDAGFVLILLFPGHFRVMQIQIQGTENGVAQGKVTSCHHIYNVGQSALFMVTFFDAVEGFHKCSSFLLGRIGCLFLFLFKVPALQ